MAKKELEMSIPKISLHELFTTQKERDEYGLNFIDLISINAILSILFISFYSIFSINS